MASVYAHEGELPYVPAAGIDMDIHDISLGFGQTDYVTVQIIPVNATDENYTIESSDTSIVPLTKTVTLLPGIPLGLQW